MAALSLRAYSDLRNDVELKLDKADMQAKNTRKRYTHDEMFSKLRA